MTRQKKVHARERRMLSLDVGADAHDALERITQEKQQNSPRRKITKTEVLRDLILDADNSS